MLKVLIVDDEHLMRKALHLAVSGIDGFEIVGEAENGEKAIKLDEELSPDIIFMDIRMPGINGVEASERIKSRNPQTEIIFVTAHDDFEIARKGINIGIHKYLLKPCSFDEIKKLLQGYKETRMQKATLHNGLLQSVAAKRFGESCALIKGTVHKLFCAYRSTGERYPGFKLVFSDLFALVPCVNKEQISYFEKKYALCDAICNDPVQTEFWLFDAVDEVYKQRSIQTHQHFVRVFTYIEDNMNREILMHRAAENTRVSVSYLSRIFNREMGVSFSNYVNIKKMRKAKQLLRFSDISVNDIAFNAGYNEPNYFCKVFRKLEDCTPTQYRENRVTEP
ncbi:MAG: response regulator transcription factor [Bacillota bacterium]